MEMDTANRSNNREGDVDEFTKRHLVNDDPELLDRGWPTVWRLADCDELWKAVA